MSGKREEAERGGKVEEMDRDLVALFDAARSGSGETVAKLAASVADVNAVGVYFVNKTQRDTCALYEAVEAQNLEAVEALLGTRGIDVNAQPSKWHRTALGLAADAGDVAITSRLLEVEGIDVNAGADGLGSPLALASIKGKASTVAVLLESADVDVNRLSRNKVPPLTEAVKRGHEAVVNLLLQDERVDVALVSQDEDALSAFAVTCLQNRLELLRQLLKSGRFDVEAEVKRFELMEKAKELGYRKVFETLEEHFLKDALFGELPADAQNKKMWYVFKRFDTNNSGYITQEQFADLAKELGVELGTAELREACVGLDTNHNGLIEFDELLAFWTG